MLQGILGNVKGKVEKGTGAKERKAGEREKSSPPPWPQELCHPPTMLEQSVRAGQQLVLVVAVMALCTTLYLLLALTERIVARAMDNEKKE